MRKLIEATRTLRNAAADVPVRPPAAAIIAAADARNFTAPQRRPARWLPWAVAAAAVLVAALNFGDRQPTGWAPAEFVTGTAEPATVTLADGTVVRLAPSTRLQIEGSRVREVTLDGRAFFAVTKQQGQPFRVHTRSATANVLGTRFEMATDERGVRLLVLEGRVALDAPQNMVEVGAGEESGVRDGEALRPTAIGHREPPAWLGRFLAFQTTPLRDAAREIERLYAVRFMVTDSTLADATITATFTDQRLDQVIHVVCGVLSAQCATRDGVVTITR
jgi:ferric-dicitrate binding protein FerR (iron transport regulator)